MSDRPEDVIRRALARIAEQSAISAEEVNRYALAEAVADALCVLDALLAELDVEALVAEKCVLLSERDRAVAANFECERQLAEKCDRIVQAEAERDRYREALETQREAFVGWLVSQGYNDLDAESVVAALAAAVRDPAPPPASAENAYRIEAWNPRVPAPAESGEPQ